VVGGEEAAVPGEAVCEPVEVAAHQHLPALPASWIMQTYTHILVSLLTSTCPRCQRGEREQNQRGVLCDVWRRKEGRPQTRGDF
jgi:hypothetical protein